MLQGLEQIVDKIAISLDNPIINLNRGNYIANAVSTGSLAIDLITGGGWPPGKWITVYGSEGSGKSTLQMKTVGSCVSRDIPPMMFDHENALDPSYLERIIGCPLTSILGNKGKDKQGRDIWLDRPKFFYFQPNTAETTFRQIHRTLESLPDKLFYSNQWWLVYEPKQAPANREGAISKDGKVWIPCLGEDPGAVQAVFQIDSLAFMLPEAKDENDERSDMALLARMFSTQIPLVRPKLGRKHCIMIATNQLRLRPAVMYGPPEYEPCGEAVKHASDIRVKMNLCAASNLVAGATGQHIEEPCWYGIGTDKYRAVSIQTTKNKTFSPFRKCFLRIWYEEAGHSGRGIDPVWDCYEYLRLTGQIEYHRGKYTLRLADHVLNGMQMDWTNFKRLILDPDKSRVRNDWGLAEDPRFADPATLDVMGACRAQFHNNTAFELYFNNTVGAKGKCADCKWRMHPNCGLAVSMNMGCGDFEKGEPQETEMFTENHGLSTTNNKCDTCKYKEEEDCAPYVATNQGCSQWEAAETEAETA